MINYIANSSIVPIGRQFDMRARRRGLAASTEGWRFGVVDGLINIHNVWFFCSPILQFA